MATREPGRSFEDDEVTSLDVGATYDSNEISSPHIMLNLQLPISKDIDGIIGSETCIETGEIE